MSPFAVFLSVLVLHYPILTHQAVHKVHTIEQAAQARGWMVSLTPWRGYDDRSHLRLWRRRAWRWHLWAIRHPYTPTWLSEALCVHRYEGAWGDDTGNGYYGGLQMDSSFEAAYGASYLARWGEAGQWPPWAQLRVAWNGWRLRGWSPWPNTAADCGLLG